VGVNLRRGQVRVAEHRLDIADEGAESGAQRAASTSAPELTGEAKGIPSLNHPFRSIAPASAPGAALFREGRRRYDGATGTTRITISFI
jgi:hypothetical protein